MAAVKGGRLRTPDMRGGGADNGVRLFVVLLAASLVMFTVSARGGGGPLEGVRSAYMTITTPVRYIGAVCSVPFQALGNVFANLTANQETLSELREENEELRARNAELEEAEQTAQRLEQLLSLQSTYDLESTAARVISGSSDSWSATVTIDKGSSSGIAVGMPVSDANGAIGQVISVGATSATVRLITDENSSVSAMIQSTRAQGILEGSADGTLTLTLVSTDTEVEVGDVVITSGLGGVFPKGLPLGTVTSVSRKTGALYYDIDVSAFSAPGELEEVLVITSLTESQRADAEDIAEADSQDDASASDMSTSDASTSLADDGQAG